MENKAYTALVEKKNRLIRGLHSHTGTFLFAIAWIILLVVLFAGFEPLLLVGLVVIFTLLAALYLFAAGKLALPFRRIDPLFWTMATFAAYVLLSALWSAKPQLAVAKGSLIFLIVGAIGFTPVLINQMSWLQLHRCARGIILGLLFSLLFLAFEYTTNQFIFNLVADAFPGLIKNAHGAKGVPAYHLNANASVITLFLWPALLAALSWSNKQVQKLLVAALLATSLFILLKTHSATAQLALIIATLAYLAARFVPRNINVVAQALWVIAVAGAVPIVMAMHLAGLQNIQSLPYSFKDRLHIWNNTAKLVPDNPVLGIGIRSSRIDTKGLRRATLPSHQVKLADRQGWHTHNIFLQTWYELGVIGAAFLLAMGLLALRMIDRLDPVKRPFAYALFASFSVVAAFGYGMWQSWLLSAYGWSVIFLLIALKYKNELKMDQPSSISAEQE